MITRFKPQTSSYIACSVRGYFIPGPSFLCDLSTHHLEETWVLAVTECYKKWVEAVALERASGTVMASFIRDSSFAGLASPSLLFLILACHLSILICENYALSNRSTMSCQALTIPRECQRLRPPTRPH